MKLYEIAADYTRFMEMVENEEIPSEAIADTLESITSLLEDKADNIACIIKNITAEIGAIKAEEQNLAERRRVKENVSTFKEKTPLGSVFSVEKSTSSGNGTIAFVSVFRGAICFSIHKR